MSKDTSRIKKLLGLTTTLPQGAAGGPFGAGLFGHQGHTHGAGCGCGHGHDHDDDHAHEDDHKHK